MSLLYDQVNEYLQLSGHTNIFAVGDCCDTPEHKMAAFAGAHGETVARNIIKEVMGCSPAPYKTVLHYRVVHSHWSRITEALL